MKKIFRFKYIMFAYVGVWLAVTAILCWKLWGICATYQKDYEQAKAAANPDLVMEETLEFFEEDHILSLCTMELEKLSAYELQTNADAIVQNLVKDKKITYQRTQNFSNRKPSYEVYADAALIGKVQLKQLPESDSFGFHMCEVTDVALIWDGFDLKSINITIPQESSVYVNGEKVSDTYKILEENRTSMISKSATDKTGKTYGFVTYELGGFVSYPEVEVKESDKTLPLEEDNGVYSAQLPMDENLLKEMEQTILDANKAYILNMNQMAGFASIASFLLPGSKAYANIQSAQGGVAWSGKPEQLDILDTQISEILSYGENLFTVTTVTKVFRRYRGVDYNEELKYEWLYEKKDNQWLISDFSYAN